MHLHFGNEKVPMDKNRKILEKFRLWLLDETTNEARMRAAQEQRETTTTPPFFNHDDLHDDDDDDYYDDHHPIVYIAYVLYNLYI